MMVEIYLLRSRYNEYIVAKINCFIEIGNVSINRIRELDTAFIIVGIIQENEKISDIDFEIEKIDYYGSPYPAVILHTFFINGYYFAAHSEISKKDKFALSDDSSYLSDRDNEKTLVDFNKAKQVRIEFCKIL